MNSFGFTRVEREIATLICGENLTSRRAAGRLHKSEQTVKNVLTGIYAKVGGHREVMCAYYRMGKFDPVSEEFTTAEKDVANLMCGGGLNSREIAKMRACSIQTVKNHLGRIYVKIGGKKMKMCTEWYSGRFK